MSDSDARPEPGPLGEEAAKLFAAAQQWWDRGPGGALRLDRPELTERLTQFQSTAAMLLRGLADVLEPPPAGAAPASPPASPSDLGED
ncbi:MAG: hypothetical protein JWO63_3277 [Frankiales bacterium]|jgi:hypothetical protein|nr:hypothetical protein [Frankiales bacterium]